MLALPSLLLLTGASLILLARRRHERVWWMIAFGASAAAWASALLLLRSVPSVIQVSVWRPEELFASRLELLLDSRAWQMVFVTTTILLSVVLTSVERRGETTAAGRAMMLVYTAFALFALQAGNLLTVATTWALMDLSAFAFVASLLITSDSARDLINRLAVDGAGVLLILGASVAQGGAAAGEAGPGSNLALLLVSLAVLMRLGLFPPHFALPRLAGVRRGLGTVLRLLPPAVALAVLGRTLGDGATGSANLWLRVGGALGLVIGALRWVLAPEAVGGRRFLVLGLCGLAALAASIESQDPGMVLVAGGALVLIVGAAVSLNEIRAPIHRAWIVLAALLVAGFPMTPGAQVMEIFVQGLRAPENRLFAGLAILGAFLLVLGSFRRALAPRTFWVSGEALAKWLYVAGLLLPLLAAIGLSLPPIEAPSPEGLVLFAILAVLAGLAASAAQRFRGRSFERWRRWLGYLDPSPLYAAVGSLVGAAVRGLRAVGDLLEGEGAMLWTYVVLLLALLAILGV